MEIKNLREAAAKHQLENYHQQIAEATEKGYTQCYLGHTCDGRPIKSVIERLLREGFDISYKFYDHGDCFVKAYWDESTNGVLWMEESMFQYVPSTLEVMFPEI